MENVLKCTTNRCAKELKIALYFHEIKKKNLTET